MRFSKPKEDDLEHAINEIDMHYSLRAFFRTIAILNIYDDRGHGIMGELDFIDRMIDSRKDRC